MSLSRALTAITLLFALVAVPAAAQEPDAAPTLSAGDVVRVTVWRNPELSGEFRIMADGSIGHPLYQAINVRGMPMPALATRLREFLATYEQNPQVVVEPMLRVAVGGEVRTPSLYVVPVGTTVGQAIAQAGSATERGNLRKVRLIRGGSEQLIDLTDTQVNAAALPVRSGDEIFVKRRGGGFGSIISPLASLVAAAAAIVSIAR